MSRRLCMLALASTALAVTIPGAAAAKGDNGVRPNQGGCPPGAWLLSDEDEWLAATYAGFATEGFTPEEAAELFEFESVDAFSDFIVANVFDDPTLNANGDAFVCRGTTNPGGIPDWFFGVADNKYHVKFAG